MAREHPEEKEKQPQIIEREITLTLLNQKLNDAINLLLEIADKVGVKKEEED